MLPGPLLPVSEECLLPIPFVRKRVVVRVKEYDRFLSCLAFEKRRFPQGTFNGFLSIRSVRSGALWYNIVFVSVLYRLIQWTQAKQRGEGHGRMV